MTAALDFEAHAVAERIANARQSDEATGGLQVR
jgi:hypothetical protein